jgi:hypothetical protein
MIFDLVQQTYANDVSQSNTTPYKSGKRIQCVRHQHQLVHDDACLSTMLWTCLRILRFFLTLFCEHDWKSFILSREPREFLILLNSVLSCYLRDLHEPRHIKMCNIGNQDQYKKPLLQMHKHNAGAFISMQSLKLKVLFSTKSTYVSKTASWTKPNQPTYVCLKLQGEQECPHCYRYDTTVPASVRTCCSRELKNMCSLEKRSLFSS